MLIGLGDDAPVYGPEELPGDRVVYEGPTELPGDRSPSGTVTIGPMTIRPAQSVARVYSPDPGAKPSLVARVLPVKLNAAGKPTIYGLPPAVAYALVVVILGGGAYLAYQRFAGGGGRGLVAANAPRRRRRARRASRRKR